MQQSGSDLVCLRGGLVVPVGALQILWALEDRGFTLKRDADGYLVVAPRERLTSADFTAIRRHRNELLALLDYVPPVEVQ